MRHLAVLHLINSFGDSSITRIVLDLVRNLGQYGLSWHVGSLSEKGDMQAELKRQGTEVVVLGEAGAGFATSAKRIRDYIVANRIDIIHTHSPRAILMLSMALVGKRQRIHLATKHILNSPGDRRWGILYFLADRLLMYAPDYLVAVSGKVYRGIMACPGVSEERVSLIRNAVDSAPFYVPEQRTLCRTEFGLTSDQVLIGSSGRLEKVKRYDLLLRGFAEVHARFPKTRLMIAGNGTLRRELEILAGDLGVGDAVIWTGFRKDVPRLLAAMDVYVMSSVNEGLSLSILEAMAAGKPVVITDVGGARELVDNGKTGLLIPPGSAEAIAGALQGLMEDPAGMSSLAMAGRDYVMHEFGMQRMMESYGKLYRTLATRLP